MKLVNMNSYVEITDGIYWIGHGDEAKGLHANPYLIVDGDEAVVIDGGSRPDFSHVMLKIISVGIRPEQIQLLIYQHYDPDLCGSIPHFEELINRENLVILSQRHNNTFISHYGTNAIKKCINTLNNEWQFSSGRKLKFYNTPYAHSPGSFVTFDEKTGTLFSSDLFGSYAYVSDLYYDIQPACNSCQSYNDCPLNIKCFIPGIEYFHQLIITSNKALKIALDQISALPVARILPQHGGIVKDEVAVKILIDKLYHMKNIGIDGALHGKIY